MTIKVLGYAAQSATGAPATYKRMRAGFEGPEQLFLGRNSADVVAILSQAPGGLELLPTADYNNGEPWLKVRERTVENKDKDKRKRNEILALPKHGDPYTEIYLSPTWYGMVPDDNTKLMLGSLPNDSASQGKEGDESPRKVLEEVVREVRKFHTAIENKYKKPTYAHYGAQGERNVADGRGGVLGTGLMASKNLFTWGEVVWEGKGVAGLDPQAIRIVKDDGNGTLSTDSGIELTIAGPDCPGDGTVPVYSGEAPGLAGIAMSFAHGQGNAGRCNTHYSYDHQGSYGDKHRRSLYATMYAIVKIAQQAQWHKK